MAALGGTQLVLTKSYPRPKKTVEKEWKTAHLHQ
jgi:hypothetical protein